MEEEIYPEKTLKDILGDMIPIIPNDCMAYMRERISECLPHFGVSEFKLRLVIDTNALFKAVRGKMLDGSCFLEKIAANPTLDLCAPPAAAVEIMEKIEQKFPKEKKTAHLDISECKMAAADLLKQIRIEEDIDEAAMAYAEERLGCVDRDDVPFFALSLSCGAHGVITDDKHLKTLEELPTWNLGDAGKMLMVTNRGTLALFIAHDVMPLLLQALFEILCAIWTGVVTFAKTTGSLVGRGLKKGYKVVSEWHPLLQVLLVAGVITAELKYQPIQKAGKWVLQLLKDLFEAIWPLMEALAAILGVSVATLLELMQCTMDAVEEIESLPEAFMQRGALPEPAGI